MDYYKNILINNEESYNKYFGNAPKIGTIDPLKKEGKDQRNKSEVKVLLVCLIYNNLMYRRKRHRI